MKIHMPDVRYLADGEEVVNSKRFLTLHGNSSRIDTIKVKLLKGRIFLNKISYFGSLIGSNIMKIHDAINVQFPLTQNQNIKRINSNVKGGDYITGYNSFNSLISLKNMERDKELFNRESVLAKHGSIDISRIYFEGISGNDYKMCDNFDYYGLRINVFEDLFNLDYGEILGDLIIGISTFLLEVPCKLDMKIDNKYGIRVENIYTSSKDTTIIETTKSSIKKCVDYIKKSFYKFKDKCDKEKRWLGIYVHVDYFDLIVHINDYEYRMTHIHNFNLSDHMRILKTLSYLKGGAFLEESFVEGTRMGFLTISHMSTMSYYDNDKNFCIGKEITSFEDNIEEDYNELKS